MDLGNQQTVNKDDIFAVFDELKAIGIKPRVALARERFTSVSYSLISAYLAEWNAALQQSDEEKFPAPPELISQGLARLWAQARLLSDEETEQQRLNLGLHRQEIESEKKEMLFEIQRLEEEQQPQEALRAGFSAERVRFEGQLDLLHHDLKESRLSNVDTVIEKKKLESDALGVVLQQEQMRIEIEDKIQQIEQLFVEKNSMQSEFSAMDLKQDAQLKKAQNSLFQAQSEIESLALQLEQQKKMAIDPNKISDLELNINSLSSELAQSKSKLFELDDNENKQRLKQKFLERDFLLKEKQHNELQNHYSEIKLKLAVMQDRVEQSKSVDIMVLEKKVKELTKKSIQYKKVLVDKKNRFNDVAGQYKELKKEYAALRSSSELNGRLNEQVDTSSKKSLGNKSLGNKIEPIFKTLEHDIASIGSKVADLDIDMNLTDIHKASTSKLEDGEKILELAKSFVIYN